MHFKPTITICILIILFALYACHTGINNPELTLIEFPEEFTQEFEAVNKFCYQTMNEGVIDLGNDSTIRIIITLSKLETGTYKIDSHNVFNGISPDNSRNDFIASAVLIINERSYFAQSGDIKINSISGNMLNGTYELLGYSRDMHNIQIYIKEGIIKNIPIHIINYGEVIDIEENTYKTVDIGDQTWMAENLRVTKYNNGKPISDYYTFNNHPLTDPEITDVFYTGKVLSISNNVCPAGWHVPAREEWEELLDYRNNNYWGAMKLKTSTGWGEIAYGTPPQVSLNTNWTGMTIEPKGYVRGEDIYWYGKKSWAKFLTSSIKTIGTDTSYINVHMDFTSNGANINPSISKNDGYSIRCVKDN